MSEEEQFEWNKRLGYKGSTFDENNYSTQLNASEFSTSQLSKADRIASEIERGANAPARRKMSYNEDKEPSAEDRRTYQQYGLDTTKVPDKEQLSEMRTQATKPAEAPKSTLKLSKNVFKPSTKAPSFTPSGSAS